MNLVLLVLALGCITCSRACTFPGDLIGDWYSTSYGTLTFTSSTFSGFTSSLSVTPLTFTCYLSSGTQYAVKSSIPVFNGVTLSTYLCMNLHKVSTIKYLFTIDNDKDSATGVRFFSSTATSISLAEACSYTDTRSAGEYELLILKDQIQSAFVACPDNLQTLFDANITTKDVTGCGNNTLSGQTSTSLIFNYSSCATGQLNSGGHLSCLYTITSDYAYVTTYNNDSTTDESTTYRFTCFTYSKGDATVFATEHPKACHTSQTPTSVDSPGVTYVMTDIYYTPPSADDTEHTVIIVLCCLIVALILGIVIALVIYFKFFKKPPPVPPTPPKIRKRKRKLSITDYSTGTLSRSQSMEKVAKVEVIKHSAGEIITGVLDRKNDVVSNGHAYEPPKKEPWQRKWETIVRPSTPLTGRAASLQRSKGFTSDERLTQLSNMTLENTGPMTTSLPESIDLCSEASPRIYPIQPSVEPEDKETIKHVTPKASPRYPERSHVSPRYAERSHSSPRLPESTGKFGARSWTLSNYSIMPNHDLLLDPITENPLSRENTTDNAINKRVSRQNPSLERPLTVKTFADSASVSTGLTAHSIASAGDIRLKSRFSHLSASNASIFDDPAWFSENSIPSQNFEIIKNLIPSIPTQKAKDQKWFLKTSKNPETSREDMDYFKSRSKLTTGLNNTSDKLSSGRASSLSLQIIEASKRKAGDKKQRKTVKKVRPTTPHVAD